MRINLLFSYYYLTKIIIIYIYTEKLFIINQIIKNNHKMYKFKLFGENRNIYFEKERFTMLNGIIKLFYTEVVKNKINNLPKEEYEINDQFKKIQNISYKIDSVVFAILKIFTAIFILLVCYKINVYFAIGAFFIEFAYIFYKKSFKTKAESEISTIKENINKSKESILKEKGKRDISFLLSILLIGLVTGFTWVLALCFFVVFAITIRDIYANFKNNL